MLSNKDTGERAFPFFDERKMDTPEYGLTTRDYFAAKAMQAMISTASAPCLFGLDGVESDTAKEAYRVADAMIEARYK